MERTIANVCRQEENQAYHYNITPSHSIEGKRVTVTTEEIQENPECVVMRKSVAVQTFEFELEEVVIPKQDLALNQRPNLAIFSSEGGSAMEIDVSSQESAMGTASQGSLSANESNSEGRHYSNQSVVSISMRETAVLAREDNVKKREEAVLVREEDVKKREEAVLIREEDVKTREEAVLVREEDVKTREEAVLAREEDVKKREVAVLAREGDVKTREEVVLEYEQKLKTVGKYLQEQL